MATRYVQFFHTTDREAWEGRRRALSVLMAACDGAGGLNPPRALEAARALGGSRGRAKAIAEALERPGFGERAARGLAFAPRLARRMPEVFAAGLPLLANGRAGRVALTRRQCAALVASGLLGALPGDDVQRAAGGGVVPLDLPSFDFSTAVCEDVERVSCLLEYLAQVETASDEFLDEIITFSRRSEELVGASFWRTCEKPLGPFTVSSQGGIEQAVGCLQADFAHAHLGGRVLLGESAQEEIRFSLCPECIAGVLFCERMLDNEVIFIVGAHQYCKSAGYGESFRFTGPCEEQPPYAADGLGRRGPHIVAFDALDLFENPASQYAEEQVCRELAKAYLACLGDPAEEMCPRQKGFATGNWGCGVFAGDAQLKALIQWLAASAAGRELVYHAFGESQLAGLEEVIKGLRERDVRCHTLYELLQGRVKGEVFSGVLSDSQPLSQRTS